MIAEVLHLSPDEQDNLSVHRFYQAKAYIDEQNKRAKEQ